MWIKLFCCAFDMIDDDVDDRADTGRERCLATWPSLLNIKDANKVSVTSTEETMRSVEKEVVVRLG